MINLTVLLNVYLSRRRVIVLTPYMYTYQVFFLGQSIKQNIKSVYTRMVTYCYDDVDDADDDYSDYVGEVV